MATEIKVPTLGESVTSATVARWLKKPGEMVALDEPVAELETDKVTVEVNAPATGTLVEITANEGEEVSVGALLGKVADDATVLTPARPLTPRIVEVERPAANPPAGINPPPSPTGPVARPATPPADRPHPPLPAAARLIAETGVDVAQLGEGTGREVASPRATCWPS